MSSKARGVHPDFFSAGQIAAEHLMNRGLVNLVHFGFRGSTASRHHFKGMVHAAKLRWQKCKCYTVPPDFSQNEKKWKRFVDYVEIIRLRISKMKRLLVDTDKTVGEICHDAGFQTTANMHVMFKRITGVTPADYRIKHHPKFNPAFARPQDFS